MPNHSAPREVLNHHIGYHRYLGKVLQAPMQPSSSRDDEKDHPELPDRLDLLDRSDPRDREERSERLEEEATEGGDEVRETAAPVDGPPAAASGSSGNVPYAGISSTMLHATSYAWLNLTSSLSTFWALPTLHLHWQLLEQNVFFNQKNRYCVFRTVPILVEPKRRAKEQW